MKAVDEPALRAELLIPVQDRLAKWKRVQQFVTNLKKTRALDSATITVARRAADGGYRLIKPPAFAAGPGASVGPFTLIPTNLGGGDAIGCTGGDVEITLSLVNNDVIDDSASFTLPDFDGTVPPNSCLCVRLEIHFDGTDFSYPPPDIAVADYPVSAPSPVFLDPVWQVTNTFDLSAAYPASVRPFIFEGVLNWNSAPGLYYMVIASRDNAGKLYALWQPGRNMSVIIRRDGFIAPQPYS